MASTEDLIRAHDLSQHSAWWDLPQDQRAKLLRDYWRSNILPRDYQLSQESNRVFTSLDRELEEPFLSFKKKRVFLTTSRDVVEADRWNFEVPSRSYEVWTLLCWRNENKWLYDFIVPQKFFSQQFSLAKRSLKKDEKIQVSVTRVEGNHFHLGIAGQTSRRIDELQSNYEPLK
jgi:hypothetical protein